MHSRHAASYWIFAALIPLIMVLIVLGIGARIIAARTGAPVFRRWFVPLATMAALFILGQTWYGLLSARVQSQISIGFFLLMSICGWAFSLHSGWRQRQAGDLLLDLGPPQASRRRGIISFILISAILAGRSGLDWSETGFRSMSSLSETVMWATAALFWLTPLRQHMRITALGLVLFGEFIEWERVLGYEWTGQDSTTLLLRIRRRIPFVGVRTGFLAVPVPLSERNAVEAVLIQHAPRT